ncbi:hypothetical protein [Spiroplasma ixodetis]|uniref:hypothetical protein n=1 Tax=Spiroplasma ixodetis TaxID=2141 RepID=UPI0025772D44|nr:hypothetical protein [Spiroplasma ixodetis]WJG69781.1 hypothetical protein SIXOD_v1c07380 [Spiroplasma ixodetis Y32]
MKRNKNYTNLQILEIIDIYKNDIFENNEFGNKKVIEWINKHQDVFDRTIQKSKEISLRINTNKSLNLNSNPKLFYPKKIVNNNLENLKLLADVSEKQNSLEPVSLKMEI